MADILNRLLLDTKNFDANLNSSKNSVNSYQGSVTNMAKTAGAGILKFAGAFGVAMGASEAFTKTINSSQTTGDAWVKMQDQMKASVDSFFASIAMGNFDGFLSNLQNVIDKAGDLSVALDNLGTKTLFNNSQVDDLNTRYQLEINAAKARNISDEERNKHLQNARGILIEMATLQKSLATANIDTSYTAMQADIAKQGFNRNISREVWDYLIKDSNRADIESKAGKYKSTVSSYENRIENSKVYSAAAGEMVSTKETDRLRRELNKYKNSAEGKFGEMTAKFIELADDETSTIGKALQMRKTANALKVSVSQKELEIANADAKINGSYNSQNGGKNGKGSKGDNALSPIGSIAEIDAKLSKLNKELIEATTTQARIAVQTTISELEARKVKLKFEAKYGESNLPNVSDDKIAGVLNGGTNKTPGSKGLDVKNIKKIKAPISNKDVDVLEKYQDNLYGISNAMSFMAGTVENGAASWLNWGASLLSSVAQAIPAIRSLIPALAAKTAGEAASSAAQIPLVGWLAAGGAAMSIISLFASLPKFANGGVIQSGSTFGDMNLARVNAGEMILNPMQQGNLFRLLDGGGNTSPNVGGEVSFRIKGKDLEGVLQNCNSQKKRIR